MVKYYIFQNSKQWIHLFQIRSRLSLLRIQEQRLSGVFEEWQKVAALKMDEVEERILNAEDELRR